MRVEYDGDGPARYFLDTLDDICINDCIDQELLLRFCDEIYCTHCGRKTKKSFQQGYCFPCTRKLAETDICMVKPELCHYHKGTCREPEWGETHCMKEHTVYLANSSGLKVGITRGEPVKRWLDQGAAQGMAILKTKNRLEAGLVETKMKQAVSDKTNWRKMLQGEPAPIDLIARFEELAEELPADFRGLVCPLEPVELKYPVTAYPEKIHSYNFDRNGEIRDTLKGIKGQYLIFAKGVINIRKFTGYKIQLEY